MKKSIKGIQPCDTIKSALSILDKAGCIILKSEISDYHFHELQFTVKKTISSEEIAILLKGFKNLEGNEVSYSCKCHWHTILFVD